MTTLDELRTAWEEHDRKLDESLRLNREVIKVQSLNRLRSPLRRFTGLLWFELVASTASLFLIGNFLAVHITQTRFVWPTGLLDAWLIFGAASSVRQLVEVSRINFDGPVIAIQQQLAELRLQRIRTFRIALLTGQIVWGIPFLIVLLQMVWRIDTYEFLSPTFVIACLAVGVAVIPLAIWFTKAFGRRLGASALLRGLSNEITGRSLIEATNCLKTLRDYGDLG